MIKPPRIRNSLSQSSCLFQKRCYIFDHPSYYNNNNNSNSNNSNNNGDKQSSSYYQRQAQRIYQQSIHGHRSLLKHQRFQRQKQQQQQQKYLFTSHHGDTTDEQHQQQQVKQKTNDHHHNDVIVDNDMNGDNGNDDSVWKTSIDRTDLTQIFNDRYSKTTNTGTEMNEQHEKNEKNHKNHYRNIRSRPDLNRRYVHQEYYENNWRQMDQVLNIFVHNYMKPLLLLTSHDSHVMMMRNGNKSLPSDDGDDGGDTVNGRIHHLLGIKQSINEDDTTIDSLISQLLQPQSPISSSSSNSSGGGGGGDQSELYDNMSSVSHHNGPQASLLSNDAMSILRFISQVVHRLMHSAVDHPHYRSLLPLENNDPDIELLLPMYQQMRMNSVQQETHDNHNKNDNKSTDELKQSTALVVRQLNSHLKAQLILVCIRLHERYLVHSKCLTQSFHLIRLLVQLGMSYIGGSCSIPSLNHVMNDKGDGTAVGSGSSNGTSPTVQNKSIMYGFIMQWMTQLIVSKGTSNAILVEKVFMALLKELVHQKRYYEACSLLMTNSSTFTVKNNNLNNICLYLIESATHKNNIEKLMELLTHVHLQIVSYGMDVHNHADLNYEGTRHRYMIVLSRGLKQLTLVLKSPYSSIQLFKKWYQPAGVRSLYGEDCYSTLPTGILPSDRSIYISIFTALKHGQKNEENLEYVLERLRSESVDIWDLELGLHVIRCFISFRTHLEEGYQILNRLIERYSDRMIHQSPASYTNAFTLTAIQLIKYLFVKKSTMVSVSEMEELERALTLLRPMMNQDILKEIAIPIISDSETWFLIQILRHVDENVARSAFSPKLLDSLAVQSIIQSDDIRMTKKLFEYLRTLYPEFLLTSDVANAVVSSPKVINSTDPSLLMRMLSRLREGFNMEPDRFGYQSIVSKFVRRNMIIEAENLICFMASISNTGINSQLLRPVMEHYESNKAKSKLSAERARYWSRIYNVLVGMEREQERLRHSMRHDSQTFLEDSSETLAAGPINEELKLSLGIEEI